MFTNARMLVAITALFLVCMNMTARGQTAFTYQGQLKQGGSPVGGQCDFEFRLFDTLVGGTQIGPTLRFDGAGANPPPVTVVAGLFTVTLDSGVGVFQGDRRFLEIAVRRPARSGTYTTLSPRQPITAAPYALFAFDAPPDFNGCSPTFWRSGSVGLPEAGPLVAVE